MYYVTIYAKPAQKVAQRYYFFLTYANFSAQFLHFAYFLHKKKEKSRFSPALGIGRATVLYNDTKRTLRKSRHQLS